MNPRKQQIEAVFEAALALTSPEQRATYLNEACGDDQQLRSEIEELLQAAEKAGGFLAARSSDGAELPLKPLESILSEGPGTIIGRYKLLQKIGEGGMGVVYMAEQEEPVRRKVALKIIKLGMDTKQVVARFEAERQALAMMDHPNIARVLDGGPTETGRPFFVMELVQGVPITEFCNKNQIYREETIKLFIPVCQAIQSAHQKGIIHRDIKPSNVLVTLHDGVPVPKVIDFGVAKATNQNLTEKTLFTNFATMIGTPAYMSPEQAEMSGLDIDTRSDIYSLGVLLYELLTGTTPFPEKRLRSVAYAEMQRIILEEEPERPSTRLTRQLAIVDPAKSQIANRKSQIDPDLDWIVMKSLEKDRNRRYETANGLAADLKRHLDNEPVVARPPSAAYRIQKLVRRHRTASAAVALVTLAVLLGVLVSTWALLRERQALKQADNRLRSAKKFIGQIFDNVAPKFSRLAGAGEAEEQLADASVDFVRELSASGADDRELNMAVARVLLYLSYTQNLGEPNSVGDYEKALQWAREATTLLSKKPLDRLSPHELKMLYDAERNIPPMLSALGKYDQALAQIEAVEPLRQRLELTPEYASWARVERVANISQAGLWVNLVGRPKEAITRYFLPLLESDWPKSVGAESSERELELLANANGWMAGAYYMLEDFARAVPPAAEAVRVNEIMVRRFPKNGRHSVYCAACRAQHGLLLTLTGHPNQGVAGLRQSRAELDALGNADPGNDMLRSFRCYVAACQAQALAFWSKDAAAPLTEGRDRLAQAEAALASAEGILPALKATPPQEVLHHARAGIAAAKESLKSDPTKSAPR